MSISSLRRETVEGPAGQAVVARAIQVASTRTPVEVLAELSSEPDLICLSGAWAGRSTLIAWRALSERRGAPFSAVEELPALAEPAAPDVAVGGGWFGYLGYESKTDTSLMPSGGPTSLLRYYDHLLRHDRETGQWWFEMLWCQERGEALSALLNESIALLTNAEPAPTMAYSLGNFAADQRLEHIAAVEATVLDIHAGDLFEANICTRFDGFFDGSPVGLFAAGVTEFDPNFAALVRVDDVRSVVSFSPEMFLSRTDRQILTAPIKGTRPRFDDVEEDAQSAAQLASSEKDAAENVMIVDLMRNDLSGTATPGSVVVEELLRLEPHPNVWHLVSYVRAELDDGSTFGGLLRDSFPPGSVTGAPKLQAIATSARVETHPREIYTGAIGYASPLRLSEFNVAIRTFEVEGHRIRIGAGGGITANSIPADEWEECLAKVSRLITRLGGRVVVRDEAYPRGEPADTGTLLDTAQIVDGVVLDRLAHEVRLVNAAGATWNERVHVRIEAAPRSADRRQRVRTILGRSDGEVHQETQTDVLETTNIRPARLTPVDVEDWWYPIKWADRALHIELEQRVGPQSLPLLCDGRGGVLETTRGNVFACHGDTITTPLSDGRILSGTTRRRLSLLAREMGMTVRFAPITLDDLATADAVLTTSSLSGVRIIDAVDGIAEWGAIAPAALALSERYDEWATRYVKAAREIERLAPWPTELPDHDDGLERAAPDIGFGARVLVVDNYDSFTYNLIHHLRWLGARTEVMFNDDERRVDTAEFDALIVSPGPFAPAEAGRSIELIRQFADGGRAVLGVCLGHQCLAAAYGGLIEPTGWPRHGLTSPMLHGGRGLFDGIPQAFAAGRYHSLAVDPHVPPDLMITAVSSDDEVVMAIAHRELPLFGVQFHPESVLTSSGLPLLRNFLRIAAKVRDR